jgi:hypothetical protein
MSDDIKPDVPAVDYEKEARLQNWVPKEEFRGNPDDWIEAKDFVERGKQINPILRANNERLLRELNQTKAQMEDLRATAEEFKKFQKESYEKKAAALESEITALREEKKRAISAGDGNKVLEIEDQIDSLKDEKAQAKEESKDKPTPPPATQADPDLDAWVERNRWYASDKYMAEVANAEAAKIGKLYPELKGKAFLDKLDDALAETFLPEKLGRKTKPFNPVEGAKPGGSSTNQTNGRDYGDLPPEAKAACDKFVKQKLMTREQYLATYQW